METEVAARVGMADIHPAAIGEQCRCAHGPPQYGAQAMTIQAQIGGDHAGMEGMEQMGHRRNA